jgi:hypothetical protein
MFGLSGLSRGLGDVVAIGCQSVIRLDAIRPL